jgi:hypothetical protein
MQALFHRRVRVAEASSCVQGITASICARNVRLRVRWVENSNPVVARLSCFMFGRFSDPIG